tara:strand:- start:74 stop:319 length:246 start_codon:yes stop_codon:yes gene_type:complete
MTSIHKTAIVSPKSNIDDNVEIGAYSFIGDDVVIGKNTIIDSHVVIKGKTKIGQDNHFYPSPLLEMTRKIRNIQTKILKLR